MAHDNPERREQCLVLVQTTHQPSTYLVRGVDGSGRQYRKSNYIPRDVRDVVDANGSARAFAYVNRTGRWHLTTLAPAETPGPAPTATPCDSPAF